MSLPDHYGVVYQNTGSISEVWVNWVEDNPGSSLQDFSDWVQAHLGVELSEVASEEDGDRFYDSLMELHGGDDVLVDGLLGSLDAGP